MGINSQITETSTDCRFTCNLCMKEIGMCGSNKVAKMIPTGWSSIQIHEFRTVHICGDCKRVLKDFV